MDREQKLIDLYFEVFLCAVENSSYFSHLILEDKVAWVADRLREVGFDTKTCGSSWGVLIKHE